MKASTLLLAVLLGSLSLPACDRLHSAEKEEHHEHQKIIATSPLVKDVTVTQQYVCQIHARRYINIRALQDGYLEPIPVVEGQEVKQGQVLFQVNPALYKARRDAEQAEANLQQRKFDNTKVLYEKQSVSQQELLLAQSELDKANAKARLAQAELNFATVTAPFDGIIDRLHEQQGSLVKKEDVLTNLSDNTVMWVYFNVPEVRYLEYKAHQSKGPGNTQLKLEEARIELVLADGSTFRQDAGDTVTIEGKFNNETGNIPFRADFPNPDRLLRHGQTGNILIHRTAHGAVVIPQRATFEILDKRYVFVIGEDNKAHQREITIAHEMDDIFIIKTGLGPSDKIVLEGVRQIHDGQHVEYEFRQSHRALENMKQHAE